MALATMQPWPQSSSVAAPSGAARASIDLPDQPLRVCLLSSAYPPAQIDGVGRHTYLMARGLQQHGHQVHVITRSDQSGTEVRDGVRVHTVPSSFDHYAPYQHLPGVYHALNYSHAVDEAVQRLMHQAGIQIVDSPVWQIEGLVTVVSRRLPVAVRLQTAYRQTAEILKRHDTDSRLLGDLEQSLIERATHLVPNSQATVATAQRVYHAALKTDRYTIIPHGIEPVPDEAVRPFDPSRSAASCTVLYVGRLEQRKGILDLFESIPRVLKAVPGTRFVIVGADNSRADGFLTRTGQTYPAYFARRYAACQTHVEFTGGVSDEILQRAYQACDLFVAPSVYESFGLIYLEAMNYAKPVIGCRAGGIPEVIDESVSGLLVDPEAPPQLAEAIITLLRSPGKLRDFGLAARQQLLARFTHLEMARRFAALYRRVIAAAESTR